MSPTLCFLASIHHSLMSLLNVPKLCAKSFGATSQEVYRWRSSALPIQVQLHFVRFSLSCVIDAGMQLMSRDGASACSQRQAGIYRSCESIIGWRTASIWTWPWEKVLLLLVFHTSLWGFSRSWWGEGDCNYSQQPLGAAKLTQSLPRHVRTMRQNKIKKVQN